jgi:diaminopimelate decarboxylase
MPTHRALPRSATVDHDGILYVGGVSLTELAATFGTPLYVYDVQEIRDRLSQCISGLGSSGSLHYAAKAYLSVWLLRLLDEYKVGIDVCSAIELAITLHAGIPPARIRLHGNNKDARLLRAALADHVGTIVVDGMEELLALIDLARAAHRTARILLRLNPGIEAHTHRFMQTGILDSKFGLPIVTGDARAAVLTALEARDAVQLIGYHAHIGTQIMSNEPYEALLGVLLAFAHDIRAETTYWPTDISPGGGIGITYTDEEPPSLHDWARGLCNILASQGDVSTPHISIELGRSIIGTAGMALYTAGNTKHIPGVRAYLCVDGGMADNIRPALYGAHYTALVANRMHDTATRAFTVAGPYCESGDILIQNVDLPDVRRGDLIVLPAAGAYCLPMSSNYNGALRPAVVVVADGEARLVQRRQNLDDLLRLDTETP